MLILSDKPALAVVFARFIITSCFGCLFSVINVLQPKTKNVLLDKNFQWAKIRIPNVYLYKYINIYIYIIKILQKIHTHIIYIYIYTLYVCIFLFCFYFFFTGFTISSLSKKKEPTLADDVTQ